MDILNTEFRSINPDFSSQAALGKTPSQNKSHPYAPSGIPFKLNDGPVPVSALKIVGDIQATGFNFIREDELLCALKEKEHFSIHQLNQFYKSWNQLTIDPYYVQYGNHYHRRDYTLLRASYREKQVFIEPRRSPNHGHDANSAYTPSNMQELLPKINDAVLNSPVTKAIVALKLDALRSLRPDVEEWEIGLHQVRVEADHRGVKPAPEDIHQDGVDYVGIVMINCENVQGGETYIRDEDKDHTVIAESQLTHALQAVLIDDKKVFHEVGKILPVDKEEGSYRDILVIKCKILK